MSEKSAVKNQLPVEVARSVLIRPYITEKTFSMIEKENKLIFIVNDTSTKPRIREAMTALYGVDVEEITTARTVMGKKAAVKFREPNGARDLATTLGLV